MQPYDSVSETLRERGYSPIPVVPRQKRPALDNWTLFADQPASDSLHSSWLGKGYSVGIAHGHVGAVDIDTDREDVIQAVEEALAKSPVRRKGKKGCACYFRIDPAVEKKARYRWKNEEGVNQVEVLMRGTQSVLPPSIHPETGQPYEWLSTLGLEDVNPDELPLLNAAGLTRLNDALKPLGLELEAPKEAPERDPDEEISSLRELNDLALTTLDDWFPQLELVKTRQLNSGAWQGVAHWRPSQSDPDKQPADRKPNLSASTSGIKDFGTDDTYTAVDLVMNALDLGVSAAARWLEECIRPGDVKEEKVYPFDLELMLENDLARKEAKKRPLVRPLEPASSRKNTTNGIKSIRLATKEDFAEIVLNADPSFPDFDPLQEMPGLLGELAHYLQHATTRYTDNGGLAVALPLLGALMGRAWRSPTDLRTNIYTAGLADSGVGKTSLIAPAKALLHKAGLREYLGPDSFASVQALRNSLSNQPTFVSMMDEFGTTLSNISGKNSSTHQREIVKALTQLYSAANTPWSGDQKADLSVNPIDCPNFCMFGASTPEQFWQAFTSKSLEDGSLARYLIMPIKLLGSNEPDRSGEDDMAEKIRALVEARTDGGNLVGITGAAKIVPMTEEATSVCDSMRETTDALVQRAVREKMNGVPSILNRVVENAIKIALVSAVGRYDHKKPEITEHDLKVSYSLAMWSATSTIRAVGVNVAENEYHAKAQKILRIVEEAGRQGVKLSEISKRTLYMSSHERLDILETLIQSGQIEKRRHKGEAGRPATVYHFVSR